MHHQRKANTTPLSLPHCLHFKTTHTDVVECDHISPINPGFWFPAMPLVEKCLLCMECLSAFASLICDRYCFKKRKKKPEYRHCLAKRESERGKKGPIMLVLCWPRPPFCHVRLYLLPSSGKVCSGLLLLTSGSFSEWKKAFNPSIISRLCTSSLNCVHILVYPGFKL